jgi:hypothetical protein
MMELKTCSKCGEELPIYKFSFRTDTNKYRDQCKMCHKGYKSNLIDRQLEIESLFIDGKKKCGKCNEVKLLSEFNNDKYTKTKYTSLCKSCLKVKGEIYRSNENSQRVLFKSRYGVSDDDILDYLNATNCKICNKELLAKDKHLDHDHKTGKYRGALCHSCNIGLGHFFDNPELLRIAANYLEINK